MNIVKNYPKINPLVQFYGYELVLLKYSKTNTESLYFSNHSLNKIIILSLFIIDLGFLNKDLFY